MQPLGPLRKIPKPEKDESERPAIIVPSILIGLIIVGLVCISL